MPTGRFTDDQVQLLSELVDASRRAKDEFMMLRHMNGTLLLHKGLPKEHEVDYGDVVVLQESGFLTVTHWGEHGFNFVVSPVGLQTYEDIHSQRGDASDAVEDDLRRFADSDAFRTRHPKAHECWQEAARLLWAKDANDRVSDIGHHCREAVQEFAESLLANMGLEPQERDKQKTKNRIAQALTHAKNNDTIGAAKLGVLDAMCNYWDAVSDLIVRQEHGATREAASLDWEDARAVVFQTLTVMYELDRSLAR